MSDLCGVVVTGGGVSFLMWALGTELRSSAQTHAEHVETYGSLSVGP